VTGHPGDGLRIWAPVGIGEIAEGADLVAMVASAVPDLADGDIVVVTSKIVSKAEGRTTRGVREDAIAAETVRLVARRGPTSIVENHLGLVMAAAGVDASNVEPGHLVLLPLDPDRSARDLREGLLSATSRNVAVLVTDTAGRAWRHGQTDLAIGAAGMEVLDDHAGRVDPYGNPLAVTAPALVDEIAGAGDLVKGKVAGRPVAVVRGLAALVVRAGEHGPGAGALPRELAGDMFALGTREAVLAAVTGTASEAFGSPAPVGDLVAALARCGVAVTTTDAGVTLTEHPPEALLARVEAVVHAFGWVLGLAEHGPDDATPGLPRFQPGTP
jgi:coenzyme F420-0:L-glutamate ligase/coenzyme F420-1:gamma-L-glutamate ligase